VLTVAVACGLAFAAARASADGIPGVVMTDAQAVTDWSGIYIGGKLGGAWGDASWSETSPAFGTAGASFSPSGFAGGVFGGGNLQLGQWIFGVELSYSGTGLSQSLTDPSVPANYSFDLDWLATVEGRIGYTWNRLFVFGKGGWAGGNMSATLVDNALGATASTSDFVDGWTIGGGLEYACWSSVILGIEYDHVDLSLGNTANCPLCPFDITAGSTAAGLTGDAQFSTVMVRASYLFGPED
jgi:outer membrane immunogenic protein